MIPVEVTQTPWRYTTFPEALDHWQSLVAGLLAFVAAVIVVVGSEWRARKALRASLASEVRLYVDHLIKLREMLTRLEPSFVDEGAARRQYDLRDLTALYPPTVYPAAAAGTMGLLSRPSAADVVDFYATVERLKTTARLMSNEPNENVLPSNYSILIELIEVICRTSLPLLSKFPPDERDAGFRAEIEKWNAAEAGAATIKTGISETAFDAIVAWLDRGRRALTARRLNTIGPLGIVGVLIIFIWGPPQPNFDEFVPLALEGQSLCTWRRTRGGLSANTRSCPA